MIVLYPILFYFTLLLLGCQQKESERTENNFNSFLERFETKELPYSFDIEFLKHSQTEISPLDTQLVSLFIEKNKMFGGDINLFDIYKYYPLYKFSVIGSFQGAIVKRQGGAGGVEDLYYLITYIDTGNILSHLTMSKQVGDCSRLQIQTGDINKSLQIEINSMIFINGCENDNYTLQSKISKKYKISKSGNITEL
ncbi:MAG: hypothetical protein KA802_12830 [Saprospiraceae bacterium]|nr:hypothetical protein [Saprospiraceae bacterium]MBP9189623.1 hypothetical protein [Chitinophagales bacterium]